MAGMKRTTIMLPADLKAKSQREARRLGISLGQLIRKSLEMELDQSRKPRRRRFFPDLDLTFTDDGPPNLVANLESFLNQIDDEDYQRVQSYAAKGKTSKKRRAG